MDTDEEEAGARGLQMVVARFGGVFFGFEAGE
jgi:hypothetical protein